MDYSLFYINKYTKVVELSHDQYEFFISGYDCCDKTRDIYKSVSADRKIWLTFPQYSDVEVSDYPTNEDYYLSSEFDEDVYFDGFIEKYSIKSSSTICIDITGFIRPHLVYLVKLLYSLGIKKIDFLYSEPKLYEKGEDTDFTGIPEKVENVKWCGPEINDMDHENDLLVMATGYEEKLVQKVLQEKMRIRNKIHLIGFPSLQLDMYQENIIRLNNVLDFKETRSHVHFAPAMDPFSTAEVIDSIVSTLPKTSNILLCPISTKPHALGMILYYLLNYKNRSVSIIFPYCDRYRTRTSIGMKKIWKYTFELP